MAQRPLYCLQVWPNEVNMRVKRLATIARTERPRAPLLRPDVVKLSNIVHFR